MRFRRRLLVALVGTLLIGVTGCGGPDPVSVVTRVDQPASGTPEVSVAAQDGSADLADGVAKVRGQDLLFSLGDGISQAEGQWDAATGAASLTRVIDGRKSIVLVFGNDMYLSGLLPDGTVLHLIVDQIPQGSRLLVEALPLLALSLVPTATKVQRGAAEFSGQLDLTRVDLSGSTTLRRLVDYLSRQAGDRADEIQFAATLDEAGRLARFRATFPKADVGQDLQYDLTVSSVGSDVSVVRPTILVVEAPPAVYQG